MAASVTDEGRKKFCYHCQLYACGLELISRRLTAEIFTGQRHKPDDALTIVRSGVSAVLPASVIRSQACPAIAVIAIS